LAAGHLPRAPLAVAAEADESERLGDTPLLLLLVDLALAQAVPDVLVHVHMREQRVVLEDRVDVSLVRRHAGDRLAGEEDLALGRLLEARDHAERRRLAAAGRTEQRIELATFDREVHVIDGRHRVEPLGDALDQDVGRIGSARRRRLHGGTVRPGVDRRGSGQRRSSRDGAGHRAWVAVAVLQAFASYGRCPHTSTRHRCESRTDDACMMRSS
jgi:hypothetical protein